MDKKSYSRNFKVIVVVDRNDSCRGDILFLLDDLAMDYVICDDIYCAMAQLVSGEHSRSFLVIGSLRQLCAESMRFLEICRERSINCCSLVGGGPPAGREQIEKAEKAIVFMANDIYHLERIIHRLCEMSGSNKAHTLTRNEFALSDEEMEALLRSE